jgi:hypothetical protein
MFRFTIRDMLWLVALVALALGWWIDHGRAEAEKTAMQDDASYMADFLFGYFGSQFTHSDRLLELERRYRFPANPGVSLPRADNSEQGHLLP